LSNYITQTILGDTIMQFISDFFSESMINYISDTVMWYITTNIDMPRLADSIYLHITKLFDFTKLGDTVIKLIAETYLGDTIMNFITRNYTRLGDTIMQHFSNNFSSKLGDTIMQYLTNNLSQSFVDNIIAMATIEGDGVGVKYASGENGITIQIYDVGDKADSLVVSINLDTLAKNLINNEFFTENIIKAINITELGDTIIQYITENFYNTTLGDTIINYITENFSTTGLGDTIINYITENFYNTPLGDTIINYITENFYNTTLGDTIMNYITNNYTRLGDTIMQHFSNNFSNELGDTILNYVTNNAFSNQSFVDSIVNIIQNTTTNETVTTLVNNGGGTYTYTSENATATTIDVVGDVTNAIVKVGDSLAKNIDHTALKDTIISLVNENSTKWFYMPSIVIDVSTSGSFTIDLYGEYLTQFSTGTIIGNAGALPPPFVKIYTKDQLNFYVIGHDDTVFSNLVITDEGMLTGEIEAGNVSDATFMNIIFVIK
jgi:hypothetical protein